MFNAEAKLEKEECRREAVVIEAARRFAATRRAYLKGTSFEALYEEHRATRDALLAAIDFLEELIGPLQEPQP